MLGQKVIQMPQAPVSGHISSDEFLGLLRLVSEPGLSKKLQEYMNTVKSAVEQNQALVATIQKADKLEELLTKAQAKVDEAEAKIANAEEVAEQIVADGKTKAGEIIKEAEHHAEKVNALQRELEREKLQVDKDLKAAEAARLEAEAKVGELQAEQKALDESKRRHDEKAKEFERAVKALRGDDNG